MKENLERGTSETAKPEEGTYIVEGMIIGMLIGSASSFVFGFGSTASIMTPGFGMLFGLIIGMLIKKKRKPAN